MDYEKHINEFHNYLIEMINDKMAIAQHNYESLSVVFKNYSDDHMNTEYMNTGLTCRQVLNGYANEYVRLQKIKNYLIMLTY